MTVTPERAVDAANELFGRHAGHRALHAKGTLLKGTFVGSAEAARLLGVGRNVVSRWARRGRLPALSGPGIDGVHTYLFSRPALVQWRTDRLPFGEAAALLGVPNPVLARGASTEKIAPLGDMGGKQRWFSRPDILRLRAERLRTTGQPPTGPSPVSGGSSREGACRN